ncbi:MAG: hypothetical protein R2764_21865 [Bacteroidales bacterium]
MASLIVTTMDTSYISQTIIDGYQSGTCVTFENEEDSTAILMGLTIRNGWPNDTTYFSPGGIKCNNSSPKLLYNRITQNSGDFGVGISMYNSESIIDNCIIDHNFPYSYWMTNSGSGLQCSNSNILIKNSMFDNNGMYWGHGAAIACSNSTISVENCILSNHNSGYSGWEGYGGAIYFSSSVAALKNVIFTGNISYEGSAIYCAGGQVLLQNCLFNENYSGYNEVGGVICSRYVELTSINSTFVNNTGCAFDCTATNIQILNSILWNNQPNEIYFDPNNDPSNLYASNSAITNGIDGIVTNNNVIVNWLSGNIDEDPKFDTTNTYPFSLSWDSPCIDSGTAMYESGMEPPFLIQQDTIYYLICANYADTIPLPNIDLAGYTRIFNERIDIGAFEFQDTLNSIEILQLKSGYKTQMMVFPSHFKTSQISA